MNPFRTSFTRALLLTLAAGSLAACKGKPAEGADSSQIVATNGTVITNPSVKIASLEIGRSVGPDKKIKDKTDEFALNDLVVYVSIGTEGKAINAPVTVRWISEKGELIDEQSQPVTTDVPTQLEFHTARPSGWQPGKYEVKVLENGNEVASKKFEVK
jgi:hypothetical protein